MARCVRRCHRAHLPSHARQLLRRYRVLLRSFEREVYVVPNSVFSRTVVLNVTRKGKEWRVFEHIGVRVEDVDAVPDVITDMRDIIRKARFLSSFFDSCCSVETVGTRLDAVAPHGVVLTTARAAGPARAAEAAPARLP